MWVVYIYLGLKRERTQIFDNFLKKIEIFEVVYKDLKDDGGFKLSFFAIMIIRAMASSLIMVTLYSNPLLQAILLMVINVLMLGILIFKSPFKELYDELAQYFYELIIFIAYLCVLLIVTADKGNKEEFNTRENTGKCIIALNTILLAGTIAFMCIEIYKKITEIYEAWKETQKGSQKEIHQQSETTRQFLTQERGMKDVSFNTQNDNSSSLKRSFSVKKSQIFPLSQSSHLNLQPWEQKDEVIFGDDKRHNREGSPQDANTSSTSSRRYVRRVPNKIHPLSSEGETSSYYFKSNYNNGVQNEAETQGKGHEKSLSNFRSFTELPVNGPFNYSASYNNPPFVQAQHKNAMESTHGDQQSEEKVSNQVLESEGSRLRRRIKKNPGIISEIAMDGTS